MTVEIEPEEYEHTPENTAGTDRRGSIILECKCGRKYLAELGRCPAVYNNGD